MIVILFGKAGVGKSFVGQILQKYFHFTFWEADNALSYEMKTCIANKKTFPQAMRDELTQKIITKITELKKKHANIVVTQALYKEINRVAIQKKVSEALFIHVEASQAEIDKRLAVRKELADLAYSKHIASEYESPKLKHCVLHNNRTEQEVKEQLQKLLSANS